MLNTSLIQLKNTMNKDEFDLKVREIRDFIGDNQNNSLINGELIIERVFKLKSTKSLSEILNWYQEIKKTNNLEISEVDLIDCKNWKFQEKEISHVSEKFFKIIGIKVQNSDSREVGKIGWYQPIIQAVGFDGGVLGLIRKKINGIPHYLINAKAEPGNYNGVQLSPTLQATKSNLNAVHGGDKPNFYEFFDDLESNKEIIFDQWLPEDGGRFYLKRNRGIIINKNEKATIKVPKNFTWITLGQIVELIKTENIVNPHLRSLISIL